MRIRVTVAALMLLLGAAMPIRAQDAAMRARERAQLLSTFRAMLQDTNADVRMAALEEALASGDAALQGMARDIAFAGEDVNLKTAALADFLDGRDLLGITVLLPERAGAELTALHNAVNGMILQALELTGTEIKANWNTGTGLHFVGGQLVPGGMDVRLTVAGGGGRCALLARVAGPKLLTGQLDCSTEQNPGWPNRATYPVRIDLP